MKISAPLRRAEAGYAGLAAAFITFALGVKLPRLVGLWEDEASHGKILIEWMRYGLAHSGSTRNLWMKDDYQGTLKSLFLWPSFALFGAGTTVLRLTTLAWGAAAVGLLTVWAWRRYGRAAGLFVAIMVAFDPYLIFTSVFDSGPGALSLLLKAGAILALGLWTEGPAALFAALGAGLLCGLAVWDKAHFAWLLVAAPLALALAPRPARGPGHILRAGAFALGAAAGAAPILWFNLLHPLATVLGQAKLADWPNHDAPRLWAWLRAELWLSAWSAREPYRFSGAELPSLRHGYTALAALAAAALAGHGAPARERREGVAWLVLTAGGFSVCALTPAPVKWHHFMVLYPLPALAAAAWLSGPATGARVRFRRAAFALAAFAALFGVQDVRRFAADAVVLGGNGPFTRASVEATHWLEAEATRTPGLHIICPDMLEATFLVESGGRLPIVDIGKISISSEAAKDLAEGRVIWIRRAERGGLYNPLIDSLEKAAGRMELAAFRTSGGAVAFTVYRAGVSGVAEASRAWASAIASVAGNDSYNSSTLWLVKAEALSREGGANPADRAAALELTHKVLALSTDPLKLRHAALILKALGAYGEAAAVFARLSRSSPGDAQLHSELAFCSARIGHKTGARPVASSADSDLARQAASQVNLAQLYIRLGRKEDGLRAARKALALKSGTEIDRSAAILLQDLGFASEASDILERLLRAAPNDPTLETDAAVAQYLTGHREEAVARLRQIVARHPELVAARRNLDAALSK